METKLIKIQIDGIFYEVKPGRNLLQTCLALGFDIPYFCYHPAMGSVGACRQCAVKKFTNADDKKGKIIMSCMEPVTEGLIISTGDPEIKAFRAAVIEGLMTNHPHDCPICDEGGECHLQDMTVMTGHTYRRFNFKKRTYHNQYLGPFIHHEMNRCIQCYRCLRFYRDYAGGTDFGVFGSSNHIYFGRHGEGILENGFSGNLVEVCPTGVFTDKTLKDHFTRKWDLTNAPSICIHCSLGCNTIVSERYGSIRRILSRYNGAVNGYFLCDRGRFGYEFVNNRERIKNIMIRTPGTRSLEVIQDKEYYSVIQPVIKGRKLIGIGSPRASLESNYALETLVGKENFYHGISAGTYQMVRTAIQILNSSPVHSPSLKEIEKADAILILGEDPAESAPMLALSIRQASRNKSAGMAEKIGIPSWNDAPVREVAQKTKSPLYIATSFPTKLDDLAKEKFIVSPADISRLGFEVASIIDNSAPYGLKNERSFKKRAKNIADELMNAENPVIITGLHNNDLLLLYAAWNIILALSNIGKKSSLSLIFPESNSLGLGLMDGKPLDDLVEVLKTNKPETLIILENNIYIRTDRDKADEIFSKSGNIVVLDHLMNETASRADILLPSGTFAESTGTIVNNEGRAQRYYRVLPESGKVKDSWKYLSDMIGISGRQKDHKWTDHDDIINSFTETYPFFTKVKEEIPDSDIRFFNGKIARQTLRFSGRTAIASNIAVSEEKPPQDHDSPLAFSMEGYKEVTPSSYLVPYYWSPGWNSAQAINKYLDEPEGSNKGGNPGVLLFSDNSNSLKDFFKSVPHPFKPEHEKLMIVPVYLIFGSEELSSKSRPVAELIPEPFILLNDKEIKSLRVNENNIVKLTINKTDINVKVKAANSVPDGIAGLSIMPDTIPFTGLPGWGKIEQIET